MDIGTLAQTYGYPIIILGTMLQGEAALLVCGFLAYQGYLSFWGVMSVAALAAVLGDTTYFIIGQHYGERFLRRLPAGMRVPLHWAQKLVEKHPKKILVFMRFLFGTRIVLPVVCGMSSIRFERFLAFNVLTALLWSNTFVAAGYLFGVAAEQFVEQLKQFELWFIVALALLAVLYHWLGARFRPRDGNENGGAGVSK